MTGAYRGGGTAGLAPRSRSDELPASDPELEPSYEVHLSSGVVQAIRREIRSVPRGLETGGWLLSDPRWHDRIILATDPGEGASFSRTSVSLDFERMEEVQRRFPHLRLQGDFHLHPSYDDIPSYTDRRAWMRGRQLVGGYYIGIIVTPARSHLGEPELSGWITTKSFCERLRLRL